MKMSRILLICLIVCGLSLVLNACDRKDIESYRKKIVSENQRKDEPGIVDYMLGAPQIEQYQKAKAKLQEVNKSTKEQVTWE